MTTETHTPTRGVVAPLVDMHPTNPLKSLNSDDASDNANEIITTVSYQNDNQINLQNDNQSNPQNDKNPAAIITPSPDAISSVNTGVQLDEVIDSVYRSYPLLRAAMFGRNIALGNQISAQGNFDLKLKAASENDPLGFYETFRHNVGFSQPLYDGGEFNAGYRIGRGNFEPWYTERETNEGGEVKANIKVPLKRNRTIDDRRAQLWMAGYSRQLVEPDIQAQLIQFVAEGSYAYWEWVAAGEMNRLASNILSKAKERTGRIEDQVNKGFEAEFELRDNLRLVQERMAKLRDTERKLQQTAIKLSQYYRDANGEPLNLTQLAPPSFPVKISDDYKQNDLNLNISIALTQRPELLALQLIQKQLDIEYTQATNDLATQL